MHGDKMAEKLTRRNKKEKALIAAKSIILNVADLAEGKKFLEAEYCLN